MLNINKSTTIADRVTAQTQNVHGNYFCGHVNWKHDVVITNYIVNQHPLREAGMMSTFFAMLIKKLVNHTKW